MALEITSLQGVDICKVAKYKLHLTHVNDLLHENQEAVLPHGSVADLGPTNATVRVYVYKFEVATRCSDASDDSFVGVTIVDDDDTNWIKIPTGLRRNVAWSFYSLIDDARFDIGKHFESKELGRLRPNYIYPDPPTEDDRMEVLLNTICDYYQTRKENSGVKVKRVINSGDRSFYCEFTGGGDLHVQRKGKSLLICNTQPVQDLSLSPEHDTESISSLIIEGEKSDRKPSLYNQLLANTILGVVTQFVTECQDKEYSDSFLRNLTELSGYSVAYTGMGHVGFYKLKMEFNKPMEFVAKIQPGMRSRPLSAAYVDYALDYFFGKIKQQEEQ